MKKSPQKFFAIVGVIVTLIVIALLIWIFGAGNWFWLWLGSWSVTAFIFYGYDKMQAKRGAWRVPEVVLFGMALAGGFIGAFLGMVVFRHKTNKNQFWAVNIISTALWVLSWWFLIR
jgi:uncharacterized membrane protein YsdA (DUF1294 family)